MRRRRRRSSRPSRFAIVALAIAIAVVGVAVGLIESAMARSRLLRVPQLLITATLVAGFAVVLVLR